MIAGIFIGAFIGAFIAYWLVISALQLRRIEEAIREQTDVLLTVIEETGGGDDPDDGEPEPDERPVLRVVGRAS